MAGRVLVTGAGGFIGGRIVEVLHELNPGSVRAGVRRWSSAARIGRLPVEILQCDISSAVSVFSPALSNRSSSESESRMLPAPALAISSRLAIQTYTDRRR